MDLFDLLFCTWPALRSIFMLGFIPTDEDFKELTEYQYECYRRKVGEPNEKIYALLPENPRHQGNGDDYNELNIVLEHEKSGYQKASNLIDDFCKGKNFTNLTEKLRYVASLLPDVFTEDTPFAIYSHFSIVKPDV